MEKPSYLYHYASIETLALILNNKTIRFSSLSKVDDIEEQGTVDFGDLGRFTFVSCWSNDPEESIPLWNLYTPNMTGVRIRLPINPFKITQIQPDGKYIKESYSTHPILTNEMLFEHGCILSPPYTASLCQVQYTDDYDKINRKVLTENDKTSIENGVKRTSSEKKVSTKDLGIYKSKKWKFQKEYRYKFFITPWTFRDLEEVKKPEDQINLFDQLRTKKLTKDFFDLDLDEKAIKNMEILIGPRTNKAQKQIIHSLVSDLNSSAVIKESELKIR
ncbi:hypothetical protein JOC34_002315 [Virgibacillus halotolerans]|uniref:DUF2971 domain-containing protein n=1 Tax=Virgibacillus halotolerans TaxID=1071053 RepID=UPI001960C4C6|nr:DUF2971 domain-containing protein [Virgibacillus halotolerans]MBM7599924.1 hypothetical protein [Virgibacillus halotolerans]